MLEKNLGNKTEISGVEKEKLHEEMMREFAERNLRFEAPRHFDEPKIDFSVFGEAGKAMENYCEKLKGFLKMNYVHFDFKDEEDRRQWQDGVFKRFEKTFPDEIKKVRQNKFRNNLIDSGTYLDLMIDDLKNFDFMELASELKEKAREFDTVFNKEVDLGDLKSKIEELEDIVYEALKEIEKFSHEKK